MDRVVCGDVGFGKTEVAVRAAFVAASAGKQVAVLVPTTLLAEQHYRNFRDRFADWPMRVEVLSRFKTAKEIKAALEQLGRRQDRRDRRHPPPAADRREVQGPRPGDRRRGATLRRAPEGSAEGPARRSAPADPDRHADSAHAQHGDERACATCRSSPRRRRTGWRCRPSSRQWDDALLREAFQRELARGGQVYFLHNDVESIETHGSATCSELVPEARIRIAHGQMPERELEQVMLDFHQQRFNVLVCTTIIESGIDIPSANTIIINRADRFGLAQLHQLRGRVGRSHHRAYAYLVVPDKKAITADAQKRLEAHRLAGRTRRRLHAGHARPGNPRRRRTARRGPERADRRGRLQRCTPNCWSARCARSRQGKHPRPRRRRPPRRRSRAAHPGPDSRTTTCPTCTRA